MMQLLPPFAELAGRWAQMVRANREQVERFRESGPREDFYAPVAASFKADPHRTDEPVLEYLRSLTTSSQTWLDIGGGAGRYALPLALHVRSVTVVDPSPGMLAILRESMAEYGIANVEPIESRWPVEGVPPANVSLISHVGYDIEEIGPFLEAMEASTRDTCIAIMLDRAPSSAASPFWPDVHGEPRDELPGAKEFLALLLARGRLPAISLFERPPMTYRDADHALRFLRLQLWVEEGSSKDARLQAAVARHATTVDGGIGFMTRPTPIAVISWPPAAAD